MKKVLPLSFFLLAFFPGFANTFTVNVSNFQFSPSTLNVTVGDVIKWVWVSGFHTTTSTSVPAGAAIWDAPIQSAGQTFSYTVLVEGTYQYRCSIHPTSMLGTIVASPNLPVVLKGFSVSGTKSNAALLQWSTVTEENTDYFAILRSTDGQSFDQIATLKAAGNSSELKNYSYTDNSIGSSSRYYYYSLKIVDKDGKYTISSTQLFKNIAGAAKLITKLSPNPISKPGHLLLQFNADKEGSMLTQLYDASGKLVKQDNMYAVQGNNNGHFHIGDVAAGNYTIVFTLDGIKETYTIMVQ